MKKHIWVFIDHYNGRLLNESLEAINAAQSIIYQSGTCVTIILLGSRVESLAESILEFGVDQTIVIDNPYLEHFQLDIFIDQINSLLQTRESPEVFFFPGTIAGKELAASLAIDLSLSLLIGITNIVVSGDEIMYSKFFFSGKVLGNAVCLRKPHIVTTHPHSFPKAENNKKIIGKLIKIKIFITKSISSAMEISEYINVGVEKEITDAEILVSGGEGIISPLQKENNSVQQNNSQIAQKGIKLISELASVLNGAVGASRKIVEAGFISYDHQVGLSGKTVKPVIYFACGISGSFQHLTGMRYSHIIVAINTDYNAPIFRYAHFGIVGDLYEIIPAIINILREK